MTDYVTLETSLLTSMGPFLGGERDWTQQQTVHSGCTWTLTGQLSKILMPLFYPQIL